MTAATLLAVPLSWIFLAVSVWGALFTVNALRPMRRLWPKIGLGFFPAWLTTELALHHLVVQAFVTAAFVYFGALRSWPGQIAAVITALSWVGLVALFVGAYRDGRRVKRALRAVIGDLEPLRSPSGSPVNWRLDWHRVINPFWMRDPNVERIRDLSYVDDGRSRHRLDVYRPRDGVKNAPVLLQIHGGAWVIGDKAHQGLPVLYHLAARGWVCVTINYGLSPRDTWPAHLIDCKRALAWVRDHIAGHGGDPDFVVVTGGSAGGHLATMMALTANDPKYQPGFEEVDTRVRGFVPFYGVFDWTNRFGIRSRADRLADLLERLVVKRPLHEAPEIYDEASPMSHVDGAIPPAMVLHGTHDTLAPVEEARHFVAMLEEHSDAPVVYAEMQGAHHAFEVFASIRAMHAVRGVEAFLAWLIRDRATGMKVRAG